MRMSNPETLTITIPGAAVSSLEGWSVMVFKATDQSFSVACVLFAADNALPTVVELGATYAYATSTPAPYHNGQIISAGLSSGAPLNPGDLIVFNGSSFVDGGSIPEDFLYGIKNGQAAGALSCGLAQETALNGAWATVAPVNLQSLPINSTAYYGGDQVFWIGVGQLTGMTPQPGLLLSTSIVAPGVTTGKRTPLAGGLTLGPFTALDFSQGIALTAQYSAATNAFTITPTSTQGPLRHAFLTR